MRYAILFTSFLSCLTLWSEISTDCDQINKNNYDDLKSSTDPASYYVEKTTLSERFEFKKQFMSGKGGAKVYWVKDRKNNDIDRVLKIFPAESFQKEFDKNKEIREIYLSCKLNKLRFSQDGMVLPQEDKNFFPDFFGFGYTNSDNTFDTKEKLMPNKKHFFMLMEFIKGQDLYAFSEDKKNSIFKDKETSKLILYQVVNALDKAHKALGFFHMDLHPGNIMLSDKNVTFLKKVNGLNIVSTVPMVKIIDFGLSTSDKYYPADGINRDNALNLSLKPSRNYSLVLVNFARNIRDSILTGPLFLNRGGEIAKDYPHGDDLQFINMMIYVFRNEFKNKGGFVDYCTSYQDCKDKLLK